MIVQHATRFLEVARDGFRSSASPDQASVALALAIARWPSASYHSAAP